MPTKPKPPSSQANSGPQIEQRKPPSSLTASSPSASQSSTTKKAFHVTTKRSAPPPHPYHSRHQTRLQLTAEGCRPRGNLHTVQRPPEQSIPTNNALRSPPATSHCGGNHFQPCYRASPDQHPRTTQRPLPQQLRHPS